jgi:hypothetical protein
MSWTVVSNLEKATKWFPSLLGAAFQDMLFGDEFPDAGVVIFIGFDA